MTTVAVRPATAADLGLIVGWGHAFFEHLRTATADPWFEGATLDAVALEARLRAGLERPFIRESPIERIGHVHHVWVEPRARGRGVARALLADAEAWFREQGVGWVELSYQPTNKVAAKAWATLGFEPYRVYARKMI